jgi:hypothetical protein
LFLRRIEEGRDLCFVSPLEEPSVELARELLRIAPEDMGRHPDRRLDEPQGRILGQKVVVGYQIGNQSAPDLSCQKGIRAQEEAESLVVPSLMEMRRKVPESVEVSLVRHGTGTDSLR